MIHGMVKPAGPVKPIAMDASTGTRDLIRRYNQRILIFNKRGDLSNEQRGHSSLH
jgi:hypothetical protein